MQNGIKVNEAKNKITVHTTSWVTSKGYVCHRWPAYFVIAGRNPLGPRGGKNGKFVDGRQVGHRFKKFEDAHNFAKQFAKENCYELV
jgi:hypothetical protein